MGTFFCQNDPWTFSRFEPQTPILPNLSTPGGSLPYSQAWLLKLTLNKIRALQFHHFTKPTLALSFCQNRNFFFMIICIISTMMLWEFWNRPIELHLPTRMTWCQQDHNFITVTEWLRDARVSRADLDSIDERVLPSPSLVAICQDAKWTIRSYCLCHKRSHGDNFSQLCY